MNPKSLPPTSGEAIHLAEYSDSSSRPISHQCGSDHWLGFPAEFQKRTFQ